MRDCLIQLLSNNPETPVESRKRSAAAESTSKLSRQYPSAVWRSHASSRMISSWRAAPSRRRTFGSQRAKSISCCWRTRPAWWPTLQTGSKGGGINLEALYIAGIADDLVELAIVCDNPKKAKKILEEF